MNGTAEDLHRTHRTAAIIAGAIMCSVFPYAAVVEFMKYSQAPFQGFAPDLRPAGPIRFGLVGFAVLNAVLIPFVRRKMLGSRWRQPGTGVPLSAEPSPTQRLMVATIVSLALSEAVAVYGLVLFLLFGSSLDFYSFLIFSLILFGRYFPRYGEWEEFAMQRRAPMNRS